MHRNEDLMKRLMMYLKDYKKESILAPLFKLLEAFFELMVPSGNGEYHRLWYFQPEHGLYR